MDIDKIKNNKYLGYFIIAVAFFIFIYAIYTVFIEKKEVNENIVIKDLLPRNLVKPKSKPIDETKQSLSKERREDVLKEDTLKEENQSEMYLGKEYDSKRLKEKELEDIYGKKSEVNAEIDIGEEFEDNKTKDSEDEVKKEDNESIKEKDDDELADLDLDIKKAPPKKSNQEDTLDNGEPLSLESEQERRDREKEEAEAYLQNQIMLYSMVNEESLESDGVSESHIYKENLKEYASNPNYNPIGNNNKESGSNEQKIKIKPGSTFYGYLTNRLNSIYSQHVDAIINITDSKLKGFRILGRALLNSNHNGIVIKCYKLIAPDGYEQSIHAVALNPRNLTPSLADEIDRHIGSRLLYATIGSYIDILANKNSNADTYEPVSTIIGGEAQKELSHIKTEVKVEPQNLLIMFY